jgi:antitoxin ParD1/3/4
MPRVTVRMPDDLFDEIEEAVDSGRFRDRSEAIRSACRERFGESATATEALVEGSA